MRIGCLLNLHKYRLVWTGQIYFRKGDREYLHFNGQWKVYRCTKCHQETTEQLKEKPIKVSADCHLT